MNLKSRIPKNFYRLFASKYLDYYISFLAALYSESSQSCSVLGLTEAECKTIIDEQLAYAKIDWGEEQSDEEGAMLSLSNMASICLAHFIEWGWLRSDFDETLNCHVVSFPEYSQLFVQLFQKLLSEGDNGERESILAVYSYLFTYYTDKDKNNEILKSALTVSRRLVQLLSNMQEGMRGYFDELSKMKNFRGIQEVLVKEINNQDSRKYAILTTTDSFYRYKEAVKELIEQCLGDNEIRRRRLETGRADLETGTVSAIRNDRALELCAAAVDLIFQIEREFDAIERKYNQLIEQKTIFASRAAARMRYIMQEGAAEEDKTLALVNLLARSGRRQEILEEFASRLHLSSQYRVMKENSLYSKREREQPAFEPEPVSVGEQEDAAMDSFILRPLYTKKQLRDFVNKNTKGGRFAAKEGTVRSAQDLEKLLFVWQEATERAGNTGKIQIGEELATKEGFHFSSLVIEEDTNDRVHRKADDDRGGKLEEDDPGSVPANLYSED